MKKIITIIILCSFVIPHFVLADEIDHDATGKIIIGISKNLGLKSNEVDVKICQVKQSKNIVEPEPEPIVDDEPTTSDDEPVENPTEDEPVEEPQEDPNSPFRFKRVFKGLIGIEDTNDLEYFETILKYIEDNNIECETYRTNHNGKLILEDMPIGYYFIYVPDFKVEDTIYVEQPVGVYLPTLENDTYRYDIRIYPKIDIEKTKAANFVPVPDDDYHGIIPPTGTHKNLIPIFLVLGLIFIVIGRILLYEKEDR